MTRDRYAKNAGAVFSLKYHLVWCPKYRRPVLVPPVDVRLKQLFNEISAEHGFLVHEMEVMPDHVHLFVESDPTLAPSHLAAQFKGFGATAHLPLVGSVGQAAFAEGYGMVETGGGVAAKFSPPMTGFGLGSGMGMALPGYKFKVVGEDGEQCAPAQSVRCW